MKNIRNIITTLFIALTATVWGQKQFVAQPIESEVVLRGESVKPRI